MIIIELFLFVFKGVTLWDFGKQYIDIQPCSKHCIISPLVGMMAKRDPETKHSIVEISTCEASTHISHVDYRFSYNSMCPTTECDILKERGCCTCTYTYTYTCILLTDNIFSYFLRRKKHWPDGIIKIYTKSQNIIFSCSTK